MLEGFPIYISGIHANISVGTLLWHPPITHDNDDIYHMRNIDHAISTQSLCIVYVPCFELNSCTVWYVAFLLSHTWSHHRLNVHFCTLLAVKQRQCILMDMHVRYTYICTCVWLILTKCDQIASMYFSYMFPNRILQNCWTFQIDLIDIINDEAS